MLDRSSEALQQAGATLMRSVDHIWVLTLQGSSARIEHMRALLERDLQLLPKHVTYFEGASSRDWGRWPQELLPRANLGATPTSAEWWMPSRVCADDEEGRGDAGRPQCLQQRYRGCIGFSSAPPFNSRNGPSDGLGERRRLPAVCNELCYTLSVVAALAAFLKTDHQRALLLEDDICATTALLSQSTRRDLDWMSARPSEWDLVKLGDCYRGGKAFFGVQRDASSQSAVDLATGTCVSRDQRLADELAGRSSPSLANNNTLTPWLPLAYCTHAIAVSRRMAEHLIRQAFPASDVFDSLLVSHIARQPALRRRRRDAYTSAAAVEGKPTLKLWNFNRSLFAQVAKVFLFNGDIVYGDCSNSSYCGELPTAWRDLFGNANFQAATRALPMMGILDDHDYGVNDGHRGVPEYESWKAYAKELFMERFGVPSSDERRFREGLYTHRTFGPTGKRTQVVILDTRWFRSKFLDTPCPSCPGRERYVPYNQSDRAPSLTMLGETQWRWLEGVLREPAELRILVSTIQVLAMDHGWERWGLIPSEVARLLTLINATRAEGLVVISGDRHMGGLYRLEAGDARPFGVPAPFPIYEVTSSSLTHTVRTAEAEAFTLRLGSLTHENNFGTVRVDWEARKVTLDLRASDDCGLSEQPWAQVCKAHDGEASRVLMNLTIGLEALQMQA